MKSCTGTQRRSRMATFERHPKYRHAGPNVEAPGRRTAFGPVALSLCPVGAGEGNRTLVFSLEGWRLSLCHKHLAVKQLVSVSNCINGLAARCKTWSQRISPQPMLQDSLTLSVADLRFTAATPSGLRSPGIALSLSPHVPAHHPHSALRRRPKAQAKGIRYAHGITKALIGHRF
jgi:hypothetical protein